MDVRRGSAAEDTVTKKKSRELSACVGSKTKLNRYGNRAASMLYMCFDLPCHTQIMPTILPRCLLLCCDRLRETTGYSRAPPQVNTVLPICLVGRLFYSLVKWDSTLPPRSHLAVSLHDNQLMHVQTPSGNAPFSNPDKGYRGIQLNAKIQLVSFFTYRPGEL